jgi:enolase
MPKITDINSIQVLDSRGTPTIRAFLTLDNKFTGIATVPSGASIGKYESVEIRDGNKNYFNGKGVLTNIDIIENKLKPQMIKSEFKSITQFDELLISLDNSPNKSNFGANTLLSLSMSFSKALALSENIELYEIFDPAISEYNIPVPMMNILNGGKHATLSSDIQEYMIIPLGFENYSDAINCCVKIYWTLKSFLESKGKSTSVGDEGGFVSPYDNNEEPLKLIMHCIEKAGYLAGKEVFIGLDVAASELISNEKYKISLPNSKENYISADNLLSFYSYLVDNYPIISIEDPFDQDDWEYWTKINNKLGSKIQIVGDDLLVTSVNKIQKSIDLNSSNTVLIKPNQIGTVSETLNAINFAHNNQLNSIISHRSGDTEDNFIADLAVGTKSTQIKSGAPSRSERTSKYNRITEIQMTNKKTKYLGKNSIRL